MNWEDVDLSECKMELKRRSWTGEDCTDVLQAIINKTYAKGTKPQGLGQNSLSQKEKLVLTFDSYLVNLLKPDRKIMDERGESDSQQGEPTKE